jgi:hypothetical protein
VISLVAMLCHHRPRETLASRGLDASTGASGPHDFAVRIDAARLATPTHPPRPAPTSVTWPTPPLAGQDGPNTPVICREKIPDYFLAEDWTAQISLIRLDNFTFTRMRFFGFVGRIRRTASSEARSTWRQQKISHRLGRRL